MYCIQLIKNATHYDLCLKYELKPTRDFQHKIQAIIRPTRVARWYIFRPKIPIWVIFGGSCNGRCWYILWTFGLFCGAFPRFGMLYHEKSGNPDANIVTCECGGIFSIYLQISEKKKKIRADQGDQMRI
jgi:hypothetical protein